MKKGTTKIITISIKKLIFPLLFFLLILFLVIFSRENIMAANKALILWATVVVPSLLPFFILAELLTHTPFLKYLNKICTPLMKPIFNVSGEGSFALIMGLLSGYPVGAKIVSNLRKDNMCTKVECERLIAFTNNSGPLFIIGTVGASLFKDTRTGILLFITHLLGALTVGFLFRFYKCSDRESINVIKSKIGYKENCNFSNLGRILSEAILSSVNTILLIGGYVLIFSVITSILINTHVLEILSITVNPILSIFNISNEFSTGILSGLMELTNGINMIAVVPSHYININILICSFLLGCGGLSVFLQVYSIISEVDISIKAYAIGKILHGSFSCFYTFLFLRYTKYFNLDAIATFSDGSVKIEKAGNIISNNIDPLVFGIVCMCAMFFIYMMLNLYSKNKLKCKRS